MDNPLLDSTVRATIYRERYNRGVYTQMINLLQDAEASYLARIERRLRGLSARERLDFIAGNATTKRLLELVELIKELSKKIRQTINIELNTGIKELVGAELSFASQLLTSAGIDISASEGVKIATAYAAVKARPLQGKHIRDFVKDFEPKTRSEIARRIRVGFQTGQTTQELARELRDSFDITHRGATTLVRTAMTSTSTVAYDLQYKELGVRFVRFVAVLDSRTSDICRSTEAREPNRYDITKPYPKPSLHPNCRSTIVPIIDDEEVVGTRPFVADEAGRSVAQIPKSERKKRIGQVSSKTNYEEWLAMQSAGFQRSVLGPTKYKLWKKGGLKLSKFIDGKSTKVYTISELKERHGRIFQELNL